MSATACGRCQAPAGYWILRRKAAPTTPGDYILLGVVEPGRDWWALARKWWDVSDAPTADHWHKPERVDVRVCRKPPADPEPLCGFCWPAPVKRDGPSLFDEGSADG